jgi:pilus assembly protein CpaC
MRLLLSAVLAAAAVAPAMLPIAAAHAAEADARGTVTIPAGTGRVMHLRAAATNIFTADPKVAEVRPASSDSLFVWGVAPGTTTIAALSNQGEAIAQFQVNVVPSTYQSRQVNGDLSRSSALGPVRARETATGIALSGGVQTPRDADRAVSAAAGQLPTDGKVTNDLTVAEPVQVSLHVRVAEMNRTLTRELGVNWQAQTRLGKDVAFGVSTTNAVVDSTVAPTTALTS